MLEISRTAKGVALDIAGVMAFDALPSRIRHYANLYDIPADKLQAAKDKYLVPFSLGEIDSVKFWYNVFQENEINLSIDEIARINSDVMKSHYIYPGALEWARNLRPKYKTALCTNSPEEWVRYWEKEYSLRGSFDAIVTSTNARVRKPDKRFYLFLAREIGLAPQEIQYFDDQRKMVEGAIEAGLQAQLFTYHPEIFKEVRS
jgi:HAD superfamily hydrolase (TIGR01509 family)